MLVAHGTLPDQKAYEASFEHMQQAFAINALSVMSLLTHIAAYFEREKRGTIAVIASVAGDRGRQSNYVYGAAKGSVSLFMQGLRNLLAPAGVHVLTIKPGFVDTPMTAEFAKGILWAQPERVARDMQRAIEKKKEIAYVPPFWRSIMLVVRVIPEFVFKCLCL